jgi:hypothetical protein
MLTNWASDERNNPGREVTLTCGNTDDGAVFFQNKIRVKSRNMCDCIPKFNLTDSVTTEKITCPAIWNLEKHTGSLFRKETQIHGTIIIIIIIIIMNPCQPIYLYP